MSLDDHEGVEVDGPVYSAGFGPLWRVTVQGPNGPEQIHILASELNDANDEVQRQDRELRKLAAEVRGEG